MIKALTLRPETMCKIYELASKDLPQRMRKTILYILITLVCQSIQAIDLGQCTIVYDTHDHALVSKMAVVLGEDIERVCGTRPIVSHKLVDGPCIVLGCTSSPLMKGRHPELNGEWERFAIDSEKNHVWVTGSDARGLAYGVFHISEAIGISPWYWWADVPVVKKKGKLNYKENYVSQTPSIKYRGLFINDEDWGMKTWSAMNYEKELGDIGPKTYDKVCELVLRLKGNMLAPAMHDCTGPFYTHPESQVKAAEWGIMITTSHCEPLLFNNASKLEWDKAVDGEWDYQSNREGILKKLRNRLKETAQYDNIYTTGLRGLHDEAMKAPSDNSTRGRILERVFTDQRTILEEYKGKPANEIPQIFVPYKETLDIYDTGVNVPEDITIVWPDDNYGYMKRVPNEKERLRKGGSGVYYHLSYLGTPHDYLWVNTTHPLLMYKELKKAYDAGADRYWLLNVGDIKPMELGVQMFMDMAWNMPAFSVERARTYQAHWLANIIGQKKREQKHFARQLQDVLDSYYRLAWQRKPEYMGYEIEWDNTENSKLHDTDFSFEGENETAMLRMGYYTHIEAVVDNIMSQLSEERKAPFFEMLGFSVKASNQMNKKFLYAQRNHETGLAVFADMSRKANDSIQSLMNQYNTMLNGKWNGMMSEVPPGYVALYQQMPEFVDKPTTKYALPANQRHEELPNILPFGKAKVVPKDKAASFEFIQDFGRSLVTLQLGQPLDKVQNPASLLSDHIDIPFDVDTTKDSIRIQLCTIPLWPVYKERSNRFGVSLDGCQPVVCENKIVEWSEPWKHQVLENRKDYYITLPIDKNRKKHTLSLIIGDPGQMVQLIRYE